MNRALSLSRQITLTILFLIISGTSGGCAKKSSNKAGGGSAASDQPNPSSSSMSSGDATPADDTQALIAEFADDVIGVDPPTADGIAQMLEEQEIILHAKNTDAF